MKNKSEIKKDFFYDVFDNTTNSIVYCGTWEEVEDYRECEGRYTVVQRQPLPMLNEQKSKEREV